MKSVRLPPMDPEFHLAKPRHRSAPTSDRAAEQEELAATMAGERQRGEEGGDPLLFLSKPTGWAVSAVTAQAELISAAVLSLSSPLLSIVFQSRAVPSRLAHNAAAALHGLTYVFVGTAYAVAALTFILAFALLLGFFLVRLWVEEPVLLRRPLHFDYTQPQPDAVVMLRRVGARGRAVPAGHEVTVSLSLVMPESDFNRHVGIFQVSAEAISSNGHAIETTTQPCMLRFRSLPVRLMRTFAMAFPLLIGANTEAQQIAFEILRYGEGSRKTEAIRVRLMPRSGTTDLPQIYEAEILLRSRLPRRKEVVYNWKWTFCVWVSLNVYVFTLALLFYCFRPADDRSHGRWPAGRDRVQAISDEWPNSDFTGALGRWRERSSARERKTVARASSNLDDEGETSELVDDLGACCE